MRIVAINASHRGDRGLTRFFVDRIVQGATQAGADCQVITLAKLEINRCLSCYRCQRGEPNLVCVYNDKDDVRMIFDQMSGADMIVFATPVYLMNMTGLLKDLLDRMYSTMDISAARLSSGQVDSPFAGHLGTARLGVFGQSFGGATAFQVCAVDSRCKASINMDGTQWGNLLDTPLQTPFVMMSGENTNGINDWALSHSPGSGYNLWVRGADHINFTDFNLVSLLFKFPLWGALGKIDPLQMERIMNAYTLAFFDQTLKGIPSPLFQGLSPDYPEVELEIFEPT